MGVKQTLVRAQDGQPLANVAYRSKLSDGRVIEGVTNARGETAPIDTNTLEIVETVFMDNKRALEQ